MGKKQKIFWIVLFSILGTMTIAALVGLKFLAEFKYAVFAMVIVWGIVLTIFQFLRYSEFKKLLAEDMPVYLAELLNAGIITQEQCLNPGKKEQEMFMSEHMSALRKRRLLIAATIILAIYGITMFFTF